MDDAFLATLTSLHRAALFGGLALFLVLEAVRPQFGFATEAARLRHVGVNLGLWLIGFGLAELLWVPMLQPAIAAGSVLSWPDAVGLPLWGQGLLGLLYLDLVNYAVHRLAHRLRWLWLLHAVHHSDAHLDTSSALRFHPLETVVVVTLQAALLILAGFPLWVLVLRIMVNAPIAFWQHADLGVPAWLDRRLRCLLVTPLMHRLHHSPEPVETNSNYGSIFSVWDRLFGTYRAPDPDRHSGYGLHALEGSRWQGIGGLLLTPWRARRMTSM